jgi:branched-chain amino acid transport system substrate-binding protein
MFAVNGEMPEGEARSGADRPGTPTRGFLFADLRGYTEFVERNGAAAAAGLLERYRALVRGLIGQFDGAEIRTEGDSFYVVFESVSHAVRAGLAIVESAATESAARPDQPIRVGVGVHAGETVETADGYVGSPVNIAARLCALAGAGEVFVSDTVRSLTQTVLPVVFASRGRKQLKGVAEPVTVYSVTPVEEGAARPWASSRTPHGRRRRLLLVAAVAASILVVAAVLGRTAFGHHSGLPNGEWKIGLDLPLSGDAASRGVPERDAVRLAIDQANASGGVGGRKLGLVVRDDAGPSSPTDQSPGRGAKNANALVADPTVLAIVGPPASKVAAAEIPITNAAGLLQCSPANTDPALTKPRDGALDLRAAAPQRINYIRTAPADDIQGPAAASFLFNDLGVRRLLVIDDTAFGREIADSVGAAFVTLGGTVIRRSLNPGAQPSTVIGPLSRATYPATGVFFGGFADTGAPQVRKAMVASGFAKLPFVSWDGIGGSGSEDGSFLQLTGRAAVGSYQSHASIAPSKAAFVDAYRSRFGREPDEYTASAYACTEVVLDALRKVAAKGATAAGLREALRSQAVDPDNQYDTVLGSIGFDANGDSRQQFVTFYRVDPNADDGNGDWVIEKQQDYGPAP